MTTHTQGTTPTVSTEASIGSLVSGLPHLRLRPDCTVDAILTVMAHSGRRIAGITEKDGTFIGFLTRSALLGKLVIAPGFDVGYRIDTGSLQHMTAVNVMIGDPAFLPSALSLQDSLAIMTEYGFHAMPVLNDWGMLVGLAEMRQLIEAHQNATRDLVESKDNLLSYLMHHENYALCGPVSEDL